MGTAHKYDRHNRRLVAYYNAPCAFDIETTSAYANGNKVAYMYEWTLAIGSNACYGRTMQGLLGALHELRLYLRLSPLTRLPIYVHNLGFEFQFLRKHFRWLNVFAVDDRKPIRALAVQGYEFRDSYILSAYSLAKTAENLVEHDIRKLEGDLDYALARHSETPLTDKEIAYCENDVLIITAYISEQMKQYGDITKIPMTNTGRVRRFVRQNCLHDMKRKGGKSSGKRYRELMQECRLTLDSYAYCKQAFQGGYTHASNKYSGLTLHDVHSVDFNSSYPYVMCSERYPMGKLVPLEPEMFHVKHFLGGNHESRDYCYLLKIRIEGLHSKLTYETYISESKCRGEKILASNGRVFSANWVETTVTDVDLDIILAVYDYTSMQVLGGYYSYKQYLPKGVIDSILTLYEDKTNLKGVAGKETEYLVSKQMLNSVYGMCVTDIVRVENQYDDEWRQIIPDRQRMQEMIDKDNASRNRFLFYPWGVFVTAYARYNLWQGILAMQDDYVYADTDSIKYINKDKHDDYIDKYNARCLEKLKSMCAFRRFDLERCKPKGRVLGVFDYEGKADYFKSLGAKRYMTCAGGKYKLTVAGLSKQNGMEYIREMAGNDIDRAFEFFDDNLSIPADRTGKQTHTYIDGEMRATIIDYLGKPLEVNPLSGVHLEPAPFELSISAQYGQFLSALRQGYILKGGYI